MLKICSFNVNSVIARKEIMLSWLKKNAPDIVCLQELKCENIKFPLSDFNDAGYHCHIHGQKAYNGVAILSKKELSNIITDIPNFKSEQSRFMQADMDENIVLINIYAPNGNPPEKDPTSVAKLNFKLEWFEHLRIHLKNLIETGKQIIILGDWNIIIEEKDVYNPKSFEKDALFLPEVRAMYRKIENIGLVNIIKSTIGQNSKDLYSWWSYRFNAFNQNKGVLIDHILTTPLLAQKVKKSGIDTEPRQIEKPSDHTPVWMEIDL